jgi:hypothetical protein
MIQFRELGQRDDSLCISLLLRRLRQRGHFRNCGRWVRGGGVGGGGRLLRNAKHDAAPGLPSGSRRLRCRFVGSLRRLGLAGAGFVGDRRLAGRVLGRRVLQMVLEERQRGGHQQADEKDDGEHAEPQVPHEDEGTGAHGAQRQHGEERRQVGQHADPQRGQQQPAEQERHLRRRFPQQPGNNLVGRDACGRVVGVERREAEWVFAQLAAAVDACEEGKRNGRWPDRLAKRVAPHVGFAHRSSPRPRLNHVCRQSSCTNLIDPWRAPPTSDVSPWPRPPMAAVQELGRAPCRGMGRTEVHRGRLPCGRRDIYRRRPPRRGPPTLAAPPLCPTQNSSGVSLRW